MEASVFHVVGSRICERSGAGSSILCRPWCESSLSTSAIAMLRSRRRRLLALLALAGVAGACWRLLAFAGVVGVCWRCWRCWRLLALLALALVFLPAPQRCRRVLSMAESMCQCDAFSPAPRRSRPASRRRARLRSCWRAGGQTRCGSCGGGGAAAAAGHAAADPHRCRRPRRPPRRPTRPQSTPPSSVHHQRQTPRGSLPTSMQTIAGSSCVHSRGRGRRPLAAAAAQRRARPGRAQALRSFRPAGSAARRAAPRSARMQPSGAPSRASRPAAPTASTPRR
mmetsp:Transcript_35782/g.105788  ORF Transcript_35782/g.105788 Transcript_35782/m.105788 type:complete len:282 (-) Transcript_35782:818-1663(-)